MTKPMSSTTPSTSSSTSASSSSCRPDTTQSSCKNSIDHTTSTTTTTTTTTSDLPVDYTKQTIVPPKTALQLLEEERAKQASSVRLCLLSDERFPLVNVTQLAGPAGSGKTQAALTLCTSMVVQQEGCQVVYLLVGDANRTQVTTRRLQSMLTQQNPTASSNQIRQWLSQIWLLWVCNQEILEDDVLESRLPTLLHQQASKIQLIVLDDIASLFRHGELNQSTRLTPEYYSNRTSHMFHISSRLKQLSSQFQIPCLILNQVTASLSSTATASSSSLSSTVEPALGLSWAQCCNTTWMISRIEHADNKRRRLHCLSSPHMDTNTFLDFVIEAVGTIPIDLTTSPDGLLQARKEQREQR